MMKAWFSLAIAAATGMSLMHSVVITPTLALKLKVVMAPNGVTQSDLERARTTFSMHERIMGVAYLIQGPLKQYIKELHRDREMLDVYATSLNLQGLVRLDIISNNFFDVEDVKEFELEQKLVTHESTKSKFNGARRLVRVKNANDRKIRMSLKNNYMTKVEKDQKMIEVEEDIKYFLNIVEEEINSFITAAGTSVEAIIAARKIWGDGNLLKMVKVLLKLIMKKCVAPSLQLDSLAMWGPAAAVALQAEFFAAKQQLKERAEELRERAEKRKRAEERNLRRAYNGRDDQDDSFWSPEDHKKFLATNSPVSVQSSLVDGPLDQEVAEKGDLSKGPGSAHRQSVSVVSGII